MTAGPCRGAPLRNAAVPPHFFLRASRQGAHSAAGHAAQATAEKTVELKDGSTAYIFKDGEMAVEDRVGRAIRMKPGQVMETRDGQKVTMRGDEVMRLHFLLREGHEG